MFAHAFFASQRRWNPVSVMLAFLTLVIGSLIARFLENRRTHPRLKRVA